MTDISEHDFDNNMKRFKCKFCGRQGKSIADALEHLRLDHHIVNATEATVEKYFRILGTESKNTTAKNNTKSTKKSNQATNRMRKKGLIPDLKMEVSKPVKKHPYLARKVEHKPSDATPLRNDIKREADQLSDFIKQYKLRHNRSLSKTVRSIVEEPYTTITIPWSCVTFSEHELHIYHPKDQFGRTIKPIVIHCPDAIPALNQIKTAFLRNLPEITVKFVNNSIVKVLNLPNITQGVKILRTRQLAPEYDINYMKQQISPLSLTIEKARDIIRKHKSTNYLSYLCKRQLEEYSAYYCLELISHEAKDILEEDAFMFVVKSTPHIIKVVYENTLPDRASIIFDLRPSYFNEAVNCIYKYFASETINKREKIAKQQVTFRCPGIISYNRVLHTSYSEWRNVMQSKLY